MERLLRAAVNTWNGFLAATRSEETAIQLCMLVLIASVAFGGLLAPLEQLTPPLLAAAYLLPVTSGKVVLEAVMFRGYLLDCRRTNSEPKHAVAHNQ